MIALDETLALAAAEIGETLGVRSLDALHLASAQRLLTPALPFITLTFGRVRRRDRSA